MKICCVYKIINLINTKVYIGSTLNFNGRKHQHFHGLRHNKHGNDHLQKSFNKHGESSFEISIVEHCLPEKLIEREQYWIDTFHATNDQFGYNKNPVAGTTANRSPEIAAKTVATRRRNNPNWHPADISERIKAGLIGKDLGRTEESKLRISKSMKKVVANRPQSHYDKMAETKKGKPIPSLNKKIRCIELDKVFESIGFAAQELQLQRTGISMVLSGAIKKTGGYTFERV